MSKSNKETFQIYDWEGNEFPIRVTKLSSITKHYKIPTDSTIDIYRDQDYRLKGVLRGITQDKTDLNYYENDEIKTVGFIMGETIEAISNNRLYQIKGLGISSVKYIPIKRNNFTYLEFECQVYLESFELINIEQNVPDKICDYFLCSVPDMLFNGITKRINSSKQYKYRIPLDHYEDDKESFTEGYSSSRDYFTLNYENKVICIQMVHKKHLPGSIDGILIEYRDVLNNFPDENFRKIVQEFLSFIFGSHMQKVGSSSFCDGYKLINCESRNPWSRKIFKNGNANPIPLNNRRENNHFGEMVNNLFLNFIKQYDQISLSDCLWKLWSGQSLPLGTNLPILSSGLETLIDSFVQFHGLQRKYTKEEKKIYTNLIKDELESLEVKLEGYEFKLSVINKLRSPYNFSIGEKMRVFFKYLNIHFDKKTLENQALLARNHMAHQSLNFDTVAEQQRIKKISDAYVTLIHRVILKILDYNSYYIDYSKEGIRYLNINDNM
ncbi:hypothetical protein [Chryseobacterium sp. 2R14A]|uniref:hypothetical protein n=1 Tax=Chryseobacterium sp. 2R14A TaxID=3380353 RepID=UPI003CEB11D9